MCGGFDCLASFFGGGNYAAGSPAWLVLGQNYAVVSLVWIVFCSGGKNLWGRKVLGAKSEGAKSAWGKKRGGE